MEKKNEETYFILNSKKNNLIILDKKNNRNYGIDLSRIISMILIINIHIIHHGGPLFKTQKFSIEHKIFIFLNVICASGVNTFGLISGYIGFNSYKFSNLFYLLFITIFYSLTISHLFRYFKPNLVDYSTYFPYIKVIIHYWYFISYFTAYFFFPLINVGITQIKEIIMKHFVINLFLMFSFLNEIMKYIHRFKSLDIFNLKNGFSYSWLLILYLFGSYLGRFEKKRNKYFCIKGIFIIIFLGLIKTKLLLIKMVQNNNNKIELNYASPTYLGISYLTILIFSNINIKNKYLIKIISFFSPLTYGIYLIHNNILVRKYLVSKFFLWILEYKSIKMLIIEILCSLCVFLFCSFIDSLRTMIFRLLKIKKLSIKLENKITIIGDKIFSFNFK